MSYSGSKVSKVAPIKLITIPRLELAAAHLTTKLLKAVQKSMEFNNTPFYLWTDSLAVIMWIHSDLHKLKVYVANRVKEIRSESEPKNWNHVRSEFNPADLISRVIAPKAIINNQLWWNGPSWLKLPQQEWPKPINVEKYDTPSEVSIEYKINIIQVSTQLEIFIDNKGPVPLMEYTNTCAKLCRIVVYIQRFINNCQNKVRHNLRKKRKFTQLNSKEWNVERPSIEEKRNAMKSLIIAHQQKYYPEEYDFLANQRELIIDDIHKKKKTFADIDSISFPQQSKVISLRPFMDIDGIIRVGNRGKHSTIPYDAKHPIIIAQNTRLSYLIINEAHYATGHGAVQLMTQYIRCNYWMHRLRDTLRLYLLKCVPCAKHNKRFESQLMADLPIDRVNQNRAFLCTGIDYAGPIQVIERYKGAATLRKSWIAIFVCLVTRAVHIDLVSDQSSMAFIMCFERFIARRGHCNRLYSDNGTAFRGAYKEMRLAYREWHTDNVKDMINKRGTEWKFMKPSGSHQGGIYEAAVKSTKHHLYRMLGSVHYTYEHLLTFLIKIEAILNSRPLYALNEDPMDMQAITPGHFLINEPLIMPPAIAAPQTTSNPVKCIRNEQQRMLIHFWKVWSNEYLTTLMQRKKWVRENHPLKIGQLVVIVEENQKIATWLLGRITKLIPSHDGIIRAVRVRTHKNELVRPIQKLCVLPIEPSSNSENA